MAAKFMIVYDFETTDLNHKKADITEVAMVALNLETFEVEGEYESLVKRYTEHPYSPKALAVSGITDEMLEEKGQDIGVVFKEMLTFIQQFISGDEKVELGGHNIIDFDNKFLDDIFNKHGEKMSKIADLKMSFDSLIESKRAFRDTANHQLATCCKAIDVVLKGGHRAMNDVKANTKLIIELMKRLQGQGTASEKEEKFRANFELY